MPTQGNKNNLNNQNSKNPQGTGKSKGRSGNQEIDLPDQDVPRKSPINPKGDSGPTKGRR